VALIYDYASEWAWAIQPHGAGLSYFGLVFDTYRALRKLGLSIDIIPAKPEALTGYKLILAPGLMIADPGLKRALTESPAHVVLGPRFGARNVDMTTPVPLPPDLSGFVLAVARVESLRPGAEVALSNGGHASGYREIVETAADVVETFADGAPAIIRHNRVTYFAGWFDQLALQRDLQTACDHAELPTQLLPEGLRCRDTATERFWFNYNAKPVTHQGLTHPPAGVHREPR